MVNNIISELTAIIQSLNDAPVVTICFTVIVLFVLNALVLNIKLSKSDTGIS